VDERKNKGGRPKREKPLTDEERREQWRRWNKTRNLKIKREREARQQKEREYEELGWIVQKMYLGAGLSQEAICNLIGGLIERRKIIEWCREAKASGSLSKSEKSDGRTPKPRRRRNKRSGRKDRKRKI
jgi:hypothetical protein